MRFSSQALIVAFATGLFAAVACGGTAIVDGANDGSGGTGGTTTTTTSTTDVTTVTTVTTTTTDTTTSTTTNVGGGMPTLCDPVCAELNNCLADQIECGDGCREGADGDCFEPHDRYLECLLDTGGNPNLCNTEPFICNGELFDWLDCRNAFPVDGNCSGGPMGDCQCTLFDAQNHTYDTFCFGMGPGQGNFCDCFVDGDYVGSCEQSFGGAECEVYSGCCSPLVFVTSPP